MLGWAEFSLAPCHPPPFSLQVEVLPLLAVLEVVVLVFRWLTWQQRWLS